MPITIARPSASDYPEFFHTYVSDVAHEQDGLAALERQFGAIDAIARIPADKAAYRYAEGKWTVREVIGHMIDTERIFTYRLLRIARADQTPLPAFDENEYVKHSNADRRGFDDLAREMRSAREAALSLVSSLEPDMLEKIGTVRAGQISARAQVFVISGHFEHHAKILRERYRVNM